MVFGRIRRWFVATFLEADRRILVLALARMADSFGNSFLIVVLPLYITTGPVD
ncbi:MFS transporter, partial [Halobacteriales archaeon QH_9_66_26]